MNYVTVTMLATHAKKHRSSVIRAMRLAGVAMEKGAGLRGGRLLLKDANRFIAKQWPTVPPMMPVTPKEG